MFLYWTNKHKYYKVFEQQTLFGTVDIVCVWGRISGNLGGYKIIPCQNQEQVVETINQITKKRQSRGYTLKSL
jgi:predicted DNA-binding WGR domain protein